MVRWFDPGQLVETGLRTVVSGVFGTYADKREIQAGLPGKAHVHRLFARRQELWIDYVADLGDGWEPTYTVAYLLSRERLAIDGAGQDFPRGDVLVMGGDQVYPTASRVEYENRTLGPYGAALPCAPQRTAPHLFAIPGNHDWYDGLTNFLRFFCQRKWIGGWRTRQQRSYFALKLPHDWWLWGVDVQFDVYIDEPQIQFFRGVAHELREGDRVILVTGKPSWKHGTDRPNRSYDNLRYLEERIIEPSGAKLVVSLSGDDHHYARYEEETDSERKRQKVTSGGGGAALSQTHHLDESLRLKRLDEEGVEDAKPAVYALRTTYPSRMASRLRPLAAPLWLPVRNPTVILGVGAVYVLPAILLQTPILRKLRRDDAAGIWDLWYAAVSSKWVLYALLTIVPALALFAGAKSFWARLMLGAAHGAAHVALVALGAAVVGRLLGGTALRYDIAVAAGGAAVAAIPGACLVAVYLVVCDLFFGKQLSGHAGQVFAGQQIKDTKNFLRLHIEPDGALSIYPVGISRVARSRELRLVSVGEPGDAWFELPDMRERVHLIEPPIRVV
jgi:hypothetical protein